MTNLLNLFCVIWRPTEGAIRVMFARLADALVDDSQRAKVITSGQLVYKIVQAGRMTV